jgi:hypothetical protein
MNPHKGQRSSNFMAQLLDPLPSDDSRIYCCYVNVTSKMQIARITNIPGWYFERVVFPGQRLVFEALPEAHLEIHTGMMASAIISDTIPCDRLQIEETLPSFDPGNEQSREEENEAGPVAKAVSPVQPVGEKVY